MTHAALRRRALTVVTTGAVVAMLGSTSPAAGHPVPAAAGGSSPTAAAPALGALASTPASWTPQVLGTSSVVRQLAAVRSTIFAVGSFSQVKGPAGVTFTRHNIFAFDAGTGRVSSWRPSVNGAVDTVTVSANRQSVFIGGAFTKVNGVTTGHLAKISIATGRVDRAFAPRPDGEVVALRMKGYHLVVGGTFTRIGGVAKRAIASVHPTSGRPDGYVSRITVSGTLAGTTSGPTRVIRLVPNHAGTRMLALGNFTTVSRHSRRQLFVIVLGTRATLGAFNPPQFHQSCASDMPQYVRAAAWGPKDGRIAVADTGGSGDSPLCDAVALYSFRPTTSRPLWVNRTGCNSLYSIAVTASDVYVGGHQRWLDDDTGCGSADATAVSRPGIGAVSQSTGRATSWNPTRSRGVGADDMLLTSAGLWVASDTNYDSTQCGGAYHPGLCLFPPAS
jgi:hypothetical protein